MDRPGAEQVHPNARVVQLAVSGFAPPDSEMADAGKADRATVRTRILNDDLADDFRRWHSSFTHHHET